MITPNPPVRGELRSIMATWGGQQPTISDATTRLPTQTDTTMDQISALAQIHRRGRLTGRDLAKQLRVTPGTLVPVFDRLEEQGYLRRVPDLVDRRLTWLEITPKGERLFQRLFRGGAMRFMRAITRLQPAERKTFERLLNRISDHLEARA